MFCYLHCILFSFLFQCSPYISLWATPSIPEIKTPKLNWGVLNELTLHAKRINSGFKLEITTQIYGSIFKSSKLELKLANPDSKYTAWSPTKIASDIVLNFWGFSCHRVIFCISLLFRCKILFISGKLRHGSPMIQSKSDGGWSISEHLSSKKMRPCQIHTCEVSVN